MKESASALPFAQKTAFLTLLHSWSKSKEISVASDVELQSAFDWAHTVPHLCTQLPSNRQNEENRLTTRFALLF